MPIVWEVFDKKGNSNTQERKGLIQRLIDIVGINNIESILGDREFIGNEWIEFLEKNGMPFIMRMKEHMYVEFNGKRVTARTLFSSIKKNEQKKFDVIINGIQVQIAATRSKDNSLVIVIASVSISYNPLNQYLLRWLIELFFKSIKSQGFDIEKTHITDCDKIKKLFFLVALATLYAVIAGSFKHACIQKIEIKNHGRPAFSLFTYGLDFLRALFDGEIPLLSFSIFNQFFYSQNLKGSQYENSNYALFSI